MDSEIRNQAIKSSLLNTVTKICEEACLEQSDLEVSSGCTSLLTLLLFDQLVLYAKDLEVFARHAGRNVITAKDVFLLVRHSEKLTKFLEAKQQPHDDSNIDENPREEN